ncbi:MAG: PIN domain-containing protein [Spirochaetales bacterium]|nr:PIN domain-containing protein [Spirochaetales bacterium]
MIRKVFVDSDVILDVATGRTPFVDASAETLSIMENGLAVGVVSSNSVTNIYYVLRKLGSSEKAKAFLRTILEYLSVIPVDHNNIRKALDSEFLDFEDGVQHYCAFENGCDLIVTRNVEDYGEFQIEVLTPREFVLRFK